MTYCFSCRACGAKFELDSRSVPGCYACGAELSRDYRAEGVSPSVWALKREREAGGRSNMRDAMLPTAKDFAGPGDPEGAKGIRDWNETHVPRDSNKNPMRPETPRKTFAVS